MTTKKKERLPVEIEESAEDDTGKSYTQNMPQDTTQGIPVGKKEDSQTENDQEERAEALAKNDVKDVEDSDHAYVRFLKSYAKSPNIEHTKVASRLGMTHRDANIYMKRFSHAMYILRNHDNPIETLTMALGNLVKDTDIEISIEEVQELEQHASRFIKGYNTKPTTSRVTTEVKDKKRELTPQEEDREDQVKRYKENYSKLKNSSRSAVLRYVLENVPFVHNTEVTPIVGMFELQEEHLMSSPQNMSRFCSSYLGNKVGPNVFETFSNIIQSLLPSDKQYGQAPWYQQQFQQGGPGMGTQQQTMNPAAANFYHEKNIIPFYMDPNSQEARMRISEYHEKKAREDEEEKRNRDWDERMKRYMNMKMMDIVDPNKQGGNGHSATDMNQMVLAGLARAVPSQDEKGNFVWKYEATRSPGMPFGQTQSSDPNSQLETVTKIMTNVMEMVNKMRPPDQQHTDTLSDVLVKSLVEKMPSMMDPLEGAVRYKKLMETISPSAGGQSGIEAGKLDLAKEKMKNDYDFAVRQQTREDTRLQMEMNRQDKQEERSQDMMKGLFGGIGRIGEKAFLPLLMMFVGSKMGGGGNMMAMLGPMMSMLGEGAGGGGQGGGMGGLSDILGSIMGGGMGPGGAGGLGGLGNIFGGMGGAGGLGGAPPAAANTNVGPPPPSAMYPESEPTPESEYERQRKAKFTVPPSDLYGYHSNPTQTVAAGQPQGYAMQQPTEDQGQGIPHYSKPETKFFSPDDFSPYTIDQLMQMTQDGQESEASIQSFKNALNEAIRRKIPQPVPTQEVRLEPEPKVIEVQETKTVQVKESPVTEQTQPTGADISAAEQSGDIA